MGKVSDRWGRRPLIVAGMLLCAVPFAFIPHLTGFVPLMLAGMVFGLGEAFVTSSSPACWWPRWATVRPLPLSPPCCLPQSPCF